MDKQKGEGVFLKKVADKELKNNPQRMRYNPFVPGEHL
jgi:hypothetical protein